MKLIPESECPELQRHPVSGIWYYRKYVTGKGEFFRSTKESRSKLKAKAVGLRMFAEWLGTRDAIKKAQFRFDDVARIYLEQKKNRRLATIQSAHLHVKKHLLPYFAGFSISSAATQWESYVKFEKSKSDRGLNHDAEHFKGILKLAYERGMIDRMPKIQKPEPKSDVGREYSESEINLLMSNAGPDLRLQIKMAYLMGMRKSEILKLDWHRVDLSEGLIKLESAHTKTKRAREIPVHIEVWAELKIRHQKSKSPFVFPSPGNPGKSVQSRCSAWPRCKKKAGITGRFHDLRHTFITRALHVHKLPASDVGAIAGMSIAMMERYRHAKGKYLKDTMNRIRGISGTKSDDEELDNEYATLQ